VSKQLKITRGFNGRIFAVATSIVFSLIVISWYFAYALDEGNSLSTVEKWIAKIDYVLGFPGYLVLSLFYDGVPPLVLLWVVVVNSAMYGFLAERVLYLIFRKDKANEVGRIQQ
jgi:hypothetical protein